MTHELSENEIAEFREIFNLVDRDRGGSITKVELGELMDTLGINTSPEEIDLMINEIDQDSNGEIDFDEFVAVMSRKVNATYSPDQVKASFRMFENPSTPGFIRVDRLLKALTMYGSDKLTSEQANELISQLEPDSNGLINYEEYVNMMMSK
ncbi:calmodulin [Thraustotheca clavata]|uniref:Calmodulin n=1 Tax=Thraustotheca clavata TaxID=74557 RepID=A0A1V9YRM9_9STRA|nr:calmodulin [Thraustotheca clavata]